MKKESRAKKRVDLEKDRLRIGDVLQASFNLIAATTESGTVLIGMTLERIRYDLAAYLQEARTGIDMQLKKALPWNKIFELTKQDPNQPNIPKVLSFVEAELTDWLKNNAGKVRNIGSEELDPEFAKNGPKTLHQLFKQHGNKVKLSNLAFRYGISAGADSDEQVDDHKHQIRLFAAKHPDVLHITRGAEATVTRLKDSNGKPTGEKIPEPVTGSSNDGWIRWSAKLTSQGFRDAADFQSCRKYNKLDSSEAVTQIMAKEWTARHAPKHTVVVHDEDGGEVTDADEEVHAPARRHA